MRLIYDPIAEDFILQAAGTIRRFHIERGQTPENCFAALECLNMLRALTPKPPASASRPEPLGLKADPEVEAFLASGGLIQKVGKAPKREVSALNLEDLDFD